MRMDHFQVFQMHFYDCKFIMLNDISGLLTTLEYPEYNDNPYPAGISK